MKRMFAPWMLALALPLLAQQPAAPPPSQPDTDKPVAVLNGEVVTTSQLEHMWDNLGTQMRTQYESSGGKGAFLENYLRKRLVLQEAIKSGFDKRPDVQTDMRTARESALFDRYIRDVVAAPIVTEAAVRKYFEEHKEEFATPERLKVRHIVVTASGVGPNSKTKEQALERIKAIAGQLHQENGNVHGADETTAARLRLIHFTTQPASTLKTDRRPPVEISAGSPKGSLIRLSRRLPGSCRRASSAESWSRPSAIT